jgi:cellulose biosynthesis protein BcsE
MGWFMTMRLGIENLPASLDELEAGGIYLLTSRDEADAFRLLLALRRANGANTRVLIEDDAAYAEKLAPFAAESFDFEVYRDPKVELFFELDYFITREAVAENSVCAVLLSHPINASPRVLRNQMRRLDARVRRMNSSVVLIYTGTHERDLTDLLKSESVYFRGIAHVLRDSLGVSYSVPMWAAPTGLIVRQHYVLEEKDGIFAAQNKPQTEDTVFLDANDILISAGSRLKDRYDWNPRAAVFADNRAVFEAAQKSQAATVIFNLTRDSELTELVNFIHGLRVKNGRNLKIAVTEESTWIRAINEASLLESGANIVFQNTASPTYMTTVINSLQGTRFQKQVILSFESFSRSLAVSQYCGCTEFEKFRELVLASVTASSEYVFSHGALVRLTPLPFTTLRRVCQEARFKKGGDLLTQYGDDYLVFLWGCNPKDTEAVLRRVFAVPPEALFKGYRSKHNDRTIRRFLEGAYAAPRGDLKPFGREAANLHEYGPEDIRNAGAKGLLTPVPLAEPIRLEAGQKEGERK